MNTKMMCIMCLCVLNTVMWAQDHKRNNMLSKAEAVEGLPFADGDFSVLEKIINKADDTIRIFNFWATWCAPCVKELPVLLEAEKELNEHAMAIKFIYVSLDFKEAVNDVLVNFKKANMNSKTAIFWLYDNNTPDWIPKVNKDWNGDIPVTLFIKNHQRIFVSQALKDKKEVLTYINQLTN